MPTAVALIAMATERGCTAASDGIEDLDLRPGQRLSMAIQKTASAPLNDIGHLPGWARHHSSLQVPSSF